MIPDKIIYTDGHDVTVTESTFQVKNTSYRLDGIIGHGLLTIRPERWPGLALTILGLAGLICGLMGLFPASMDIQSGDSFIDANNLAIWTGAGLLVIGLLVLIIVRERYAVRIATAEGEKNAVVSSRKEYITQIVDAISRAYTFLSPSAKAHYTTVKK